MLNRYMINYTGQSGSWNMEELAKTTQQSICVPQRTTCYKN